MKMMLDLGFRTLMHVLLKTKYSTGDMQLNDQQVLLWIKIYVFISILCELLKIPDTSNLVFVLSKVFYYQHLCCPMFYHCTSVLYSCVQVTSRQKKPRPTLFFPHPTVNFLTPSKKKKKKIG